MGLTRKFTIHKRGELVEVKFTGTDRFRAQGTFEPLHADRIVGIDTESLTRGGKLDTVLVPMYFSTGPQVIEVPVGGRGSLDLMLEAVCERYSTPDDRPSRHEQRNEREGRRDGRREMIDPVLLVFFNLPYDIGRLCHDHPQMLRALASGADTYRVRVGEREVEVARMVLGAGSSFEWYVRELDGEGKHRITRLLGIDCHGYWKSSLRDAAKATGVTEKVSIDLDFARAAEDLTEDEWSEFKRYAAGDAQSTAELYGATVALLRAVDARVVRRTGVVPPSAPGAAARIAFSKAHDLHPERPVWRRYPAWADQLGCDAYRGGRAFCARPGRHEGVSVWDIKSAYPYAMTQLPDPVTVRCGRVAPSRGFSDDFVSTVFPGMFGVLVIDGEGLDPHYPALRCHDEERGRLRGVYGPFRGLPATIPEIVIGVVAGSLRVRSISDGVVMQGDPERSFLRRAMLDFFAVKENPANAPALQAMGKLLANSTYGKLVEVQCNQHWIDSDVMCPPFEDLDSAARVLAKAHAECPIGAYDDLASRMIERWAAKHRIGCRDALCLGCGAEPILAGPAIPLRRRMSAHRRYECGQYFMPLYAAQITGLTSAALGLMARCTQALQGDTDSVHVDRDIHSSKAMETFHGIMLDAGYEWPRTGLGHWSLETPEPSAESYCARVKLYSHHFTNPVDYQKVRDPDGTERKIPIHYKQAKHGFGKYPGGAEALHWAIRDIVCGIDHTYQSKPSPRKIREALVRGLPVGEFVSREVSVHAGMDPNTRIDGGVCYWNPLGPESSHHPSRHGGGSHA